MSYEALNPEQYTSGESMPNPEITMEYLKNRVAEAAKIASGVLGNETAKGRLKDLLTEVADGLTPDLAEEMANLEGEKSLARISPEVIAKEVIKIIPWNPRALPSLADQMALEEFLADWIPRTAGRTL